MTPLTEERIPRHLVQFYEGDEGLIGGLARFIGAAIEADEVGLVVATPGHRAALDARLVEEGIDVGEARRRGAYLTLDAEQTLDRLVVDGAPDPARFDAIIGALLRELESTGRRVRAFGEMVAVLVRRGNAAGATALEGLWNDLLDGHRFALFCAYSTDALIEHGSLDLAAEVVAMHSAVRPSESYTALPDGEDRLRMIAELQHRSRWLETEVAARRSAEERLAAALLAERAAHDAAQAALLVRDEFLAVAAHELRTPLTSVLGYAQLLTRKLDAPEADRRLAQPAQRLEDQARRLAFLVEQLMDVTRLDSGRLGIERRPTDLSALIEEAAAGARLWSERHEIVVDCPRALHADLDAERIAQVIGNLLNNAIKFSPAGGRVTLAARSFGAGVRRAVELLVADQGPGIAADDQARIFDRYYQGSTETPPNGLGLGLHIAREIVHLHGGEIRVECPAAGGTRFVVRLPAPSASPTAAPPAGAGAAVAIAGG